MKWKLERNYCFYCQSFYDVKLTETYVCLGSGRAGFFCCVWWSRRIGCCYLCRQSPARQPGQTRNVQSRPWIGSASLLQTDRWALHTEGITWSEFLPHNHIQTLRCSYQPFLYWQCMHPYLWNRKCAVAPQGSWPFWRVARCMWPGWVTHRSWWWREVSRWSWWNHTNQRERWESLDTQSYFLPFHFFIYILIKMSMLYILIKFYFI